MVERLDPPSTLSLHPSPPRPLTSLLSLPGCAFSGCARWTDIPDGDARLISLGSSASAPQPWHPTHGTSASARQRGAAAGDSSDMDPPVPFPNTVVKRVSADDTRGATRRDNTPLPAPPHHSVPPPSSVTHPDSSIIARPVMPSGYASLITLPDNPLLRGFFRVYHFRMPLDGRAPANGSACRLTWVLVRPS